MKRKKVDSIVSDYGTVILYEYPDGSYVVEGYPKPEGSMALLYLTAKTVLEMEPDK